MKRGPVKYPSWDPFILITTLHSQTRSYVKCLYLHFHVYAIRRAHRIQHIFCTHSYDLCNRKGTKQKQQREKLHEAKASGNQVFNSKSPLCGVTQTCLLPRHHHFSIEKCCLPRKLIRDSVPTVYNWGLIT